MPVNETKPVVIALDYDNPKSALDFLTNIDPKKCRVKVGKELFTSAGPGVVLDIQRLGFDVFLDLKFHDIPNTTASAIEAAAEMGVWMVNVHASGGPVMLKECVARMRARKAAGKSVPLLIAVTVLTSMDAGQLQSVGVVRDIDSQVLALATLAKDCGFDGVVCSAREVNLLRRELGEDFLLVTPGIRPAFAVADDQVRIVTPSDAVRMGSDYLVIGRPITKADSPQWALETILKEISG
ncbi:MAG: orotidine-5'-phosphate decarboxylase [Hahellaceae bacterium]|nr:orotidine-5'-phosphate decarboxylase [Hahellaceae bacterium]MCP5211953.1 orotidine-5'-phosphate decarboxylase [Hahellaceae bacterium]